MVVMHAVKAKKRAPVNACKKRGAWLPAPVKKILGQNNAPICLQIPSKVMLNLGKSFLLL
jgi:hypothetical protein